MSNKTTKVKKMGIWMDHAEAHVMEYGDAIITNIIVSASTHEDKEKSLHKGERMMHNREQQKQSEYYKTLGETIKNFDEVMLFGPTEAKAELLNILKADNRFSKIKFESLQAEKMTENQEHAYVKAYFSKS
jgi:hypothetical protein